MCVHLELAIPRYVSQLIREFKEKQTNKHLPYILLRGVAPDGLLASAQQLVVEWIPLPGEGQEKLVCW